jgi:single-strand DNA-binding protein
MVSSFAVLAVPLPVDYKYNQDNQVCQQQIQNFCKFVYNYLKSLNNGVCKMSGTHQSVLVVGKLGRDPELRYTNQGTPVCSLNLATDESYTDNQGQKQQQTEWHRVSVFGRQAEAAAQHLAKGRTALVEGRLKTRKYQDQQGQDRYTTEIRAQRVVFMGGNQGQQSGGKQQPQAQQQAQNSNPPGPLQGPMDDAPF